LLHDKADDFTVVNQAVKAAGDAKPRWAKGLVNGVLRNFLRQKDALKIKLQNDEVALYSYPQWWINKLKNQYPAPQHPCGLQGSYLSILETGNLHPPMTLRVNVQKSNAQEYVKLLARQDIEATHLGAQAVMLTKPMPVEQVPGFADGVVSVQDYGAQLAAHLLDLKKGHRVLDACAAPGGKSGHILEIENVHLIALDNDETRLNRVESNLSRLGLTAQLIVADAAKFKDERLYDRILADVPCTASGIVRRHVDIKWLRRERDIATFTQQQSLILQQLWQLLAKGGKLLYVTCSIFNEENQQQIDNFLQKNADATQLPLLLTNDIDKNIQIKDGQLNNLQLVPCSQHDGLFYALLHKN
jgi:16S rRNA (cytosine967-C5)-methyltransferase